MDSSIANLNISSTLLGMITIAVLSCCTNFSVLYMVLVRLRKAKLLRPCNLLTAHLAFVGVSSSFFGLFNTTDNVLIEVPEFCCSVLAYLKNTFYTAYFSNVFALAYERMIAFRAESENISTIKLLSLVWLTSTVFSVPAAFTTVAKSYYVNYLTITSSDNLNESSVEQNCKGINLLGNSTATTIYEVFRFMVFTVGIIIYMLYAVIHIHSVFSHLRQSSVNPSARLQAKLRSVYFVYFHAFTFVLVSLTTGLVVLARRLLTRASHESLGRFSTALLTWSQSGFVLLVCALYYTLNPFLSLLLLEGKKVFCCVGNQLLVTENTNEANDVELFQRNGSKIEPSRYSSFAMSSSDEQVKPVESGDENDSQQSHEQPPEPEEKV